MGKLLIIKDADFSAVAVGKLDPTGTPTITISVDGVVTITCVNAISVYYTTDGSNPTTESAKYTGTFSVERDTTIKVIAEYFNGTTSNVVSKTYSIEDLVKEEIDAALLLNGVTTWHSKNYANDPTLVELRDPKIRATIMLPIAKALKEAPYAKNECEGVYTHIYLPKGAKKITLNMTNANYYYGLCVWYKDCGFSNVYDSGWTLGGKTITKDLSDYSDKDIWISSGFKIGKEGTTPFTTETIESLGWSMKVEY